VPGVALAMLVLALAVGGINQERFRHAGVSRSACEPWDQPGLRVADFRAAAAGNEALATEVVGRMVALARKDAGVFGTADLALAPFRGEGYFTTGTRVGWPLAWLGFGGFTRFEDVPELRRPAPMPPESAGGWRWLAWEPGLMRTTVRGPTLRSINIDLGALATLALLATGIALACGRGLRRARSRPARRLWVASAVLAATALLLLPRWRERAEVVWPSGAGMGPTLADTEASLEGAAAVALIARVMPALEGAADQELVQVFWRLPRAAQDVTSFGWPTQWFTYGVRTPLNPAGPDPRVAERRLSVLADSVLWARMDETGTQRFVAFNYAAFAAVLVPVLMVCASPRLLWVMVRRRRRTRWMREGRCLGCGYVGGAGPAAHPAIL
jgi:hypothetical protein